MTFDGCEYKPVTVDEAPELHRRAVAGDERARERLCLAVAPFLWNKALFYQSRRTPAADLYQIAMVSVLRAIDKFDPAKGFLWSTYAGLAGVRAMYCNHKRLSRRDSVWATEKVRGDGSRQMDDKPAPESSRLDEMWPALREGLAKLEREDRSLLLRRAYHRLGDDYGETLRATAKRLGISPNLAHRRERKALRELGRHLGVPIRAAGLEEAVRCA